MPAINHPINLHWQDNPPCCGVFLYSDKVSPIVLAQVQIIKRNGVTAYKVCPFVPEKNFYGDSVTWYWYIHFYEDLKAQKSRFWGPIDLDWFYANFNCKDVDYRKPLKWTQPKRLPKEEEDADR